MENLNKLPLSILFILIISQLISVKGQISTPCTTSMMSSLSPCMSYLTGSSKNRASPTSACCGSLKSITGVSMDCACLIVTGNVPLPSFISQALAISLPKACGTSVPLQCKSSGVLLPPPGPVLFAPPPPPRVISPHQSPVASPDLSPVASPPLGHKALKTLSLLAASVPVQAPSELLAPIYFPDGDMAPTTTSNIRPVLTPSTSASRSSHTYWPYITFTFVGITVINYYM